MEKIIIAIDGFSSSGKSTMAKNLAKTIGYTYIDTGAMYRAVTLYSLENGIICNGEVDEKKLQEAIGDIEITLCYNPQTSRPDTYLNGINVEEKIRGIEVARYVSQIAALGFVRKSLVSKQQAMGKSKGVVMDGRDVGTVIFPEAELKIFVTASPEVRAQRRWEEMKAKGDPVSYEEILENVKERDRIDSTRTEGPLRQAEDARVLDNSHLSIEEQQAWLLNQYQEVLQKSEL